MTKYSIKNICMGIGIGLIIASVANISAAPRGLTEDDIRREAAKHNLIVMNTKDLIKKQPEENKEAQEQPKQTPQQAEKAEQTVVIVIESGATSEGIAELLLNHKLIDNKQTFINRLKELKRESKVQIGTFKIPAGSSIDKVIDIITATPK